MNRFVDRFGPEKKLTARALQALQQYSWPGNVRELQMVVQRACILSAKEAIEAEDLPLDVRDQNWKSAAVRTGLTLAEMEKEYIETVLKQNEGHRGKTARHRLRLPKPGQFRNNDAKAIRQVRNDAVKTRPIRQQRMQKHERRPAAMLRGVDGPVGETPVHDIASSRVRLIAPVSRRGLINQIQADSSAFRLT